jgi:hypothetical protein
MAMPHQEPPVAHTCWVPPPGSLPAPRSRSRGL